VEGKGTADGGGTESGDESVEPVRLDQLSDLSPHEEDHGDIGQGVEGQVEEVGNRRRRWARPAEGLDGQGDIAEGPRQEAQPEGQGRSPTGTTETPLGDAEGTADDFDAADDPAVEPRPRLVTPTQQERDQVSDEDENEQSEGRPEGGSGSAPLVGQ